MVFQGLFRALPVNLTALRATRFNAHRIRTHSLHAAIVCKQRDDTEVPKCKPPLHMTPQLYDYLIDHTREPQALQRVRLETSRDLVSRAHNQVSPEQGQFLAWLVESLGVRRAIEVGVFTGYSALAVALALPEDGLLVACDRDESTMAIAEEHWKAAGVSHKVEVMLGPALQSLETLIDRGLLNSFDFAFIDADKRAYPDYYEALLRLVRPGGVIAIDNVLWYGKVADHKESDKRTLALRAFNDSILRDDRISLSIVPIGDGIALARRR